MMPIVRNDECGQGEAISRKKHRQPKPLLEPDACGGIKMTREELLTLCDDYVHDETISLDISEINRTSPAPTTSIIHCFREAEISAAEMQSLLAYVCQHQNDELDWSDADRLCDASDGVGRLENPGNAASWTTDEDHGSPISNRRPR